MFWVHGRAPGTCPGSEVVFCLGADVRRSLLDYKTVRTSAGESHWTSQTQN